MQPHSILWITPAWGVDAASVAATVAMVETAPVEVVEEAVPAIVVTAPADEPAEAAGQLSINVDAKAISETTGIAGFLYRMRISRSMHMSKAALYKNDTCGGGSCDSRDDGSHTTHDGASSGDYGHFARCTRLT